jgi:hypothetical protein
MNIFTTFIHSPSKLMIFPLLSHNNVKQYLSRINSILEFIFTYISALGVKLNVVGQVHNESWIT